MNEIDRMQKYIDATEIKNSSRYDISVSNINAIYEMAQGDFFKALCLIFQYGRARGYRAAEKETETA